MIMPSHPADKLIVALDGMDVDEVLCLIKKLPRLKWVKVGLELFVNAGPKFFEDLRSQDLKIFLDLKFHDIPATVAGACRSAAGIGAEIITVHSCAGMNALVAAKRSSIEGAREKGLSAPKLLGVTVLTSWDYLSLKNELGIDQPIQERVEALAQLVFSAGLDGCVCSPLEVKALRKIYQEPFELVTPGIRFQGADSDDQARIMSPDNAIKFGASRLVVGRPITASDEPTQAFERFCRAIEEV